MRKNDRRLNGILGTVIFHLIAAIIFMSFQIRSLNIESTDVFEMEFIPEDVSSEENKMIELPVTAIERIFQGDEEMLNIARNLANKAAPSINPDDYIDMVKEELIKSGKLGRDNYIDEKKRLADKNDEENVAIKDGSATENEKPSESQEMAANYQGPTRIYYELVGRTHTYLPVPIYKCQGSGKVVLNIEVMQNGYVDKAMAVASQSTTSDPCLIEAALNAANISRFNSDINSPKIQTGTLTYHFVAQ